MLPKKWRFPKPSIPKKDASKHTKRLFWAWIAYQTVKGILTTSLIWIPAIYLWMNK